VWQLFDWMQPIANLRGMSNAVIRLPAQPTLTLSCRPRPTSVSCTSRSAFMERRAHVQSGTERPLVGLALCALVYQRALLARERCGLVVGFDEALAHLGQDEFGSKRRWPMTGWLRRAAWRVPRVSRTPGADRGWTRGDYRLRQRSSAADRPSPSAFPRG
jgi:hypothetical protein